jgi:uncharacterized protein HemX
MDAGEKELRKAFEDVTTNNVKAVVDFSQGTRKLIRELEQRMNRLEEERKQDKALLESLRMQLANVQTKVYSGGT